MRALVQRVREASVTVDGQVVGAIGEGLLVLCGFEEGDGQEDLDWCAKKIVQLRIFDDAEGVMNRSLQEINGELLLVSQFTLHAMVKKGNRPSYIRAAGGELARYLYLQFCATASRWLGKSVQQGVFGAHMHVALENNGPVTIWIDTKNKDY